MRQSPVVFHPVTGLRPSSRRRFRHHSILLVSSTSRIIVQFSLNPAAFFGQFAPLLIARLLLALSAYFRYFAVRLQVRLSPCFRRRVTRCCHSLPRLPFIAGFRRALLMLSCIYRSSPFPICWLGSTFSRQIVMCSCDELERMRKVGFAYETAKLQD
jgi:hypothetical protein